jgi:hypothetical protein
MNSIEVAQDTLQNKKKTSYIFLYRNHRRTFTVEHIIRTHIMSD